MLIYDYNNRATWVALPSKAIKAIIVIIYSGDETGYVIFEDGDYVRFDASQDRCFSFYDGEYILTGKKIVEWMEYSPDMTRTASYERQEKFDIDLLPYIRE